MRVAKELQKWTAHFGWTASAQDRNFEILLGLLALALLAGLAFRKLTTTLLTLRALALAPTLSRRVSEWVKSADYSDNEVWGADGAGEGWIMLRKEAIDRLASFFRVHYAKSIAWGNEIRESFSDLRFTDANRVPFPFMRAMREKFSLCSVVTRIERSATVRPRRQLEPGRKRFLRSQPGGLRPIQGVDGKGTGAGQ